MNAKQISEVLELVTNNESAEHREAALAKAAKLLREHLAEAETTTGLLERAATLIGESLIADSFDAETTAAFKDLHDDIMAVILGGNEGRTR